MDKFEKADANPFRTVEANGTAVKSRFSSASSIRTVFNELQEKDEEEAKRRERILKVYNGHLPFDPVKLKAKGLGNLANFNSGELKGTVDARASAIHDMALDTTPLVELRPLPAALSGPDAVRIAEVVSDEFSVTLRESRRFLPAISTMVREADLHGLGPVSWPTYEDYQPVALERGQLKFPEDASSVSSDNDLYMIESVFPVWYLMALFDNPSESAAEGWDLAVVKEYLIRTFIEHSDTSFQAGDETGTSVRESALALWRQNRYLESKQFDTLKVIHAYVREMSGERTVTHYIVPTLESVDGFMFKKPDAYENMDQCMIWLPYTVTERYARAIRGLASYLFPIIDINNRLLCQIFDVAFRSSSFILTSSTPGQNQQLTITEHGPYTVVPANLTPAQSQVSPNFQQLAAVREMGRNVASNNALGASGPASLPERVYSGADRKTKEQVMYEAQAGSKVEQSLFVLRATVFDAVFRESFRRFMRIVLDSRRHSRFPEVKAFITRCERRGVSLKVLRNVQEDFSIHMCRDLVTGGAGAKAGILTDVLSTLGGNLDEQGRLAATRDIIMSRLGQKSADKYRPEVGRDALPSDAASHAALENNDLRELSPVLASSDQLHWSHIPIHGNLIQNIVQSVQSGQIEDPQKMLDMLQLAAEHIQEHIRYGGTQIGMERAAKEAMNSLRSLAPIVRALTLAAQAYEKREMAAEEERQQEFAELQARAEGQDNAVKVHEIDTGARLKMRAQDLDQQVKMAAVAGKTQVDAFKASAKADLDKVVANMRRYINAGRITGNPPPQTSGLETVGQL